MVDISKVVKKEKPHTCSICKEKFGSPGALPTHVKCKHDTVDISAAKQSKVVKPCKTNVDEEKVATTSLSRKKAASPEKQKKPNFDHLKRRHPLHTAVFTSEVINDPEKGMTPSELVKTYSNFRLCEPKVCRWMKMKEGVLDAAVGEHKKLIKICIGTKCNQDLRKKGH